MSKKERVSVILLKNYDRLNDLFQRYNISQVRIFGSVARNEDKETSDVDFLIDIPENSTLLQYGQLRYDLEELLQVPVDLLTYTSLNPKVLEHFCLNSIKLEELAKLTKETAIQERLTDADKTRMNLNGVIWVIDRILNSCDNISKEEFINSEMIQDAVTRNIQLLGQIASQIPKQELEKLSYINTSVLKACISLKEALFMNVDYTLLWHTISTELGSVKQNIQQVVKERESSSKTNI